MNRRPKLRIVAPAGAPRLRNVAPAASPEEAAAMVAALEQFMRDTAPTPAPPAGPSPWGRAALLEGTGYAPGERVPWAS